MVNNLLTRDTVEEGGSQLNVGRAVCDLHSPSQRLPSRLYFEGGVVPCPLSCPLRCPLPRPYPCP